LILGNPDVRVQPRWLRSHCVLCDWSTD